jgi:hypothetical protein
MGSTGRGVQIVNPVSKLISAAVMPYFDWRPKGCGCRIDS